MDVFTTRTLYAHMSTTAGFNVISGSGEVREYSMQLNINKYYSALTNGFTTLSLTLIMLVDTSIMK